MQIFLLPPFLQQGDQSTLSPTFQKYKSGKGRGGFTVNPSDDAGLQVFLSVALWGTGGWGGGERSSCGDRDVKMKQRNIKTFLFVFDLIKTWFDFLDCSPLSFYHSGL